MCWYGSRRSLVISKTGWKKRELEAASILHGQRFPANTGGSVDVESAGYCVQVKARRVFSLKQIEAAVLEIDRVAQQKQKQGMVMLKRAAGKGKETPWLIVVTAATWRELNGPLPGTG